VRDGRRRATNGEGTLGITAAFLSAGVPVVVSSAWPIDDRVTAGVMRSFYRHLAAAEPVATALRRAQLEASRSAEYAHPFYWAGFTVVGDGAAVIDLPARRGRTPPASVAVLAMVLIFGLAVLVHRRRPVDAVE